MQQDRSLRDLLAQRKPGPLLPFGQFCSGNSSAGRRGPRPRGSEDGTVLGRHEGAGVAYNRTTQRPGYQFSGKALCCREAPPVGNQLVVGPRRAHARHVRSEGRTRWQHLPTALLQTFACDVVTRYRARPVTADVETLRRHSVGVHRCPCVRSHPGTGGRLYHDRLVLEEETEV